jgi:RNA polymerase sigma factor (sigma-70 family)
MGNNGKAPKGLQQSSIVVDPGALFRANAPGIRSFCRRLLSDQMLADDAVQQTFEIVLGSFGSLRNPDHSRAWIFQIARNECYRLLKQPRHMELVDEECAHLVPTPLHATIDANIRMIVRDAIDTLSPIYREAVLLRDMEGFSYAEIAEITQVAPSAVKFRIFKGRELLMERLKPVLLEWRNP